LINIFLLLVSFVICLGFKPILKLLSMDGQFIDGVIPFIHALGFTYGPSLMISNWFRGNLI
jgi:hypothetical protein